METPTDIQAGTIIQLDPASELAQAWGPQLCIVDKVEDWGVRAYFMHAGERGKFGPAYLRVERKDCVPVGTAEWVAQ